ncbi:gluconate 2-dehydrogenase subunit 3 family protein [Oxalobacteraceae bacterium CAVE-383]|nr:gluconate 2-dehydrogenase subunit 3 family protein [Oxalobacteraceae bacterium CAVE-383]
MQIGLLLPAGGALLACSRRLPSTTQNGSPPAFFTGDERNFIHAATARLIPDSDDSAGAIAAAVPFFIERQLAGPFGAAETWYMQGPWQTGTPEQSYQLSYTPAQLYRQAIRDIDDYCRRTLKQPFHALPAEQQDNVLHGLESGDIALATLPSAAFFAMLWQNTQEGFLADPMYGGNRAFAGWKLIGFPGPRYNYVEDIKRYGQRYAEPVTGLLGRDGTRILGDPDQASPATA